MWHSIGAKREGAKALGDRGLKSVKLLDGRMIIEKRVMKEERWAGSGRSGVRCR